MYPLLWFAIAWIAGIAAILGSLMALGSLLLWVLPSPSGRPKRSPNPTPINQANPWQQRLVLLTVALAIAAVGLTILVVVPFPSA